MFDEGKLSKWSSIGDRSKSPNEPVALPAISSKVGGSKNDMDVTCKDNGKDEKQCRTISSNSNSYNYGKKKNNNKVSDSITPLPPASHHPLPTITTSNTRIKSTVNPNRLREMELHKFYRNYNPMEGVLTAVVLGGFFAFVCLLVVYKTKCKPMWKNRKKRLTNTPATHSMNENNEHQPQCGPSVTVNGIRRTSFMDDLDEKVEGDEEEEEDEEDGSCEYECIPLKSVFTSSSRVSHGEGGQLALRPGAEEDEEEEGDIYFLDEFGNYVFPLTSPVVGASGGSEAVASCSCPPSAEELNIATALRRQSQASAISNAYTVKSLPGAYLYIPLLDAGRTVSLSSVRRSLSDPEIHFSPPFGHPIILTVNSAAESEGGTFFGPSFNVKAPYQSLQTQSNHYQQPGGQQPRHSKRNPSLQQRSHSIQPDSLHHPNHPRDYPCFFNSTSVGRCPNDDSAANIDNDVIAIQVIQPTPNISPTCSLKSFNADSTSPEIHVISEVSSPMTPIVTPPSPAPSLKRRSVSKPDRRVSFSQDSIDKEEAATTDHKDGSISQPSQCQAVSPGGKHTSARIPFMNYLQVPGQGATPFFPPQLTVEAQIAQTSPQAKKRRATRLMKAGSFCSIASDGDGDIFDSSGELITSGKTRPRKQSSSGDSAESAESSNQRSDAQSSIFKTSFDPLSDYSEFQHDDCRSDISDLFGQGNDEKNALKNQGTFSDQEGSIKSLSIDQEEIGFGSWTGTGGQIRHSLEDEEKNTETSEAPTVIPRKTPPYNNPEYDEIMQHHINIATEDIEDYDLDEELEGAACISSSCSISMGSDNGLEQQQISHQITVPVTIEHPPPELRCCPIARTEEEADSQSSQVGAAQLQFESNEGPPAVPEGLIQVNFARQETTHTDSGLDTEEIVPFTPSRDREELEEDGQMRMVLVRDIGVQVCGDSPNLNRTKKYHDINPSSIVSSSSRELMSLPSEVSMEEGTVGTDVDTNKSSHSETTIATTREEDGKSEKESFPTEILF